MRRTTAARSTAAAFGLLLGGLSARVAHAEGGSTRFEYETSVAECPPAARVRALVVARLGVDPFVETDEAKTTLRIAITRDADSLVAIVQHADETSSPSERRLHERHGDCSELAATAALTASILIDPTGSFARRREARTQPPPAIGPTAADDPFAPEAPPPPPPPPKEPPEKLRAFVGARAIGSAGFMPAPAFGLGVDGGLRLSRFVVRVEGRIDLPTSTESLADGSHARTSLILGSLVPCVTAGVFALCGVVSAGSMLVESRNVSPSERRQAFFFGAGLRPVLEVPITEALRLEVTAEGMLPLRRITVSVRQTDMWTAPAAAFAIGAGFSAVLL